MKEIGLEQLTVELVPAFTGADEQSARSYFDAKLRLLPLIRDRVMLPFQDLLKAHTEWNDSHVPTEKQTDPITLGDITFVVTSEPKTKRPPYKTVIEELENYLTFLKQESDNENRPKGIRTLGKTERRKYIEFGLVIAKLEELTTKVQTPGVTQGIKHNYEEEWKSPIIVPVSYGVALTEHDALTYVRAQSLDKILRADVVVPFETALKNATTYTKTNLPPETEARWSQVASHRFRVVSKPEDTVKYAEIIKQLMHYKEFKKKDPERGELIMIRDGVELPEDVRAEYDLRNRDGKQYIGIDALLTRLAAIKAEHTNPSLNQSISHYPMVIPQSVTDKDFIDANF